jgi:hypothetical protein
MIIYLPKGSIMRWSDLLTPTEKFYPTEHNRAALSVDTERIGDKQRMVNGTLRSWFIADKRTWSTSWSNVPHSSQFTVDGKMGGNEIEEFYLDHPGAFNLEVVNGDGSVDAALVNFSEFSKVINKRGRFDFLDINITLEEC